MLIAREAEAQPELGVVLEERVRPGRAAPLGVHGPGGGGEVSAVDRRAAGGVRDQEAVAEELREELEVRGLAAPRARARELEERLEVLRAAHGREVDARAIVDGERLEEGEVRARRLEDGLDAREVDGALSTLVLGLDRAGVDAEPAAGAVLEVGLQRVADVGEAARVDGRALEARGGRERRGAVEELLVVELRADHRVRTHERAVAALDAEVGLPHRHELRDVALLPLRRSARIGAVHGERAHRDLVAASHHHERSHLANERRRLARDHREPSSMRGDPIGYLDTGELRQRLVHRSKVLAHDLGALDPVRLLDRATDLRDRLLAREDPGDGEEAGLHDGVGVRAHARLARHLRRVDDPEREVLLDDRGLHLLGQLGPHRVARVNRVDEERRARRRDAQNVEAFEKAELVAADEARGLDQVARSDGLGAEAQVRRRLRPRLLGVVDEVRLRVDRGIFSNDLDAVLVRADRAVCAEAEEHRAHDLLRLDVERRIEGQARMTCARSSCCGCAGERGPHPGSNVGAKRQPLHATRRSRAAA